MCGRFVAATPGDAVARYFDAVRPTETLAPSYNVAPTDPVYAVVADAAGERRVDVFGWGLVPHWAADRRSGAKMINARAETVATRGAFAAAYRRRRCLVPMDGFYEWAPATPASSTRRRPAKQPVYVHRPDGAPLAVAAIWATWRDPAHPERPRWWSTAVITTRANATVAPAHDRMPAMLEPSAWDAWLDPGYNDDDGLAALLEQVPEGRLALRPVSDAVNRVTNQGPHLIEPVANALVVDDGRLPLG